MGCRFPFQGIFLTQGSNPRLLHWQVGSLLLCGPGSPQERTGRPFPLFLVTKREEPGGKWGRGLQAPHSILPLCHFFLLGHLGQGALRWKLP